MLHTPIIDSEASADVALAQNPTSIAPAELVAALRVLSVTYIGFDGHEHRGRIVMHEDVAADIEEFFARAFTMQFPIQKVIPISNPVYAWDDAVSCDDNNSSGFNYRHVSGDSTGLSNHALGRAFDINPVQNIYIRYDENLNEVFRAPSSGVYDEHVPGTLSGNHSLVNFLKARGWQWGGDWKPESGRVDYQHFEKKVQ